MRKPLIQFAARSIDKAVLLASSSGGVFTELARSVFAQGGCVFGVGWRYNPFMACHKKAEREEYLAELRGAKYLPSDMTGIFKSVAKAIETGKCVLFSGTPCQTAVMKNMFPDKKNLILCAVICHSVPEVDVWNAYVEELEKKAKSKIVNVQFRCKQEGWRRSRFVVDFENLSCSVNEPLDDNVYMRAFFSGLSVRTVCSKCLFRNGENGADIMIGDFWGIENCFPEIDDDKGVSAVLVYSEKGKVFLDSTTLNLNPVTYEQILAKNPHIEKSPIINEDRRMRFMSLYRKVGIAQAFRLATVDPIYTRISRYCLRKAKRLLHSW